MSGIGGHVNRADRARRARPDDDLDAYIRRRLDETYREHLDRALEVWADELTARTEAVAAFAEAIGTPLTPWQRVLVEAHLDPRTIVVSGGRRSGRTLAQRLSLHALGVTTDPMSR